LSTHINIFCNQLGGCIEHLLELTPANMLEEISDSIQLKHVESDQVLFYEGQEAEGVYSICHGGVKLVKNTGKSTEQIILLSAPNEMMGVSTIFNGEKLHYTAIAIEPSQVCFLPRKSVLKLIEVNPLILMTLMKKVNKTIEEIENHTTLVMTDDSETIVLRTMHELKGKFGTDSNGFIRMQMPVKDLANYLCISKTNLYRVLNNLREKVVLQYEVDRYRLFDRH